MYTISGISIAPATSAAGVLDSRGYMWFTPDVSASTPSWVQLPGRVSFFSTDGDLAVVSLSSGSVYLCTAPDASCNWAQRGGVTAIQVAISGTKVVALEIDTNAIKYTDDITVSSPVWTQVSNPTATILNQVSIDGATLVGVSNDGNVYYCATLPTCTWETLSPPTNELATFASVAGSYVSLVVDSGKIFYSVGGSTWTENTDAPSFAVGGVSSLTNAVFPTSYYFVPSS